MVLNTKHVNIKRKEEQEEEVSAIIEKKKEQQKRKQQNEHFRVQNGWKKNPPQMGR